MTTDMRPIAEKQLFLLKTIQDKVLISSSNTILIKLMALSNSVESHISFLAALQNAGAIQIVDIDKIGGTQKTFVSEMIKSMQFRGGINFKELEKNSFSINDVLEIIVLPDFYQYFLDFCKENDVKDPDGIDKKLLKIIDSKELEKIKGQLMGKEILWKCCLCKTSLDSITSENIEHWLDQFKKGKAKSCKNGHHNQFKIKNGEIQFFTDFLPVTKLEKEKLAGPIDSAIAGATLKSDN